VKEVENKPRSGGGIKKPGKFADGSNKNRQKLQAIISIFIFKITLRLALLAKRMLTMEKFGAVLLSKPIAALAFYVLLGFKPVIHFITGFKTSLFGPVVSIYCNQFSNLVQVNAATVIL